MKAGGGVVRMTVVRTGPMTVLKDRGRLGQAALGVAPSGAADRSAYHRANRLVGNPPDAAVLECTLGGLRVRFDGPATVALTGTDAALTVDGRTVAPEQPVDVPAGAEVTVGNPRRGLRSYLAVRGGFDVPPVLGSRSTDLLGGVGPPRPAAGDVLPIGPPPGTAGGGGEPAASVDVADVMRSASTSASGGVGGGGRVASVGGADAIGPAFGAAGRGDAPVGPASGTIAPRGGPRTSADGTDPVLLEVDLGPRDDWFTPEAIDAFLGGEFTVTPAGNAVGLRLDGPALTRRRTEELPSEGVVRGAVQVPPDGRPIVFQADHPVTGGYPVIAVLTPPAADRAAQIRPGRRVRFVIAEEGRSLRDGGSLQELESPGERVVRVTGSLPEQ